MQQDGERGNNPIQNQQTSMSGRKLPEGWSIGKDEISESVETEHKALNRVAHAAFGRDSERSLRDFYAMYGSEANLPESERCKSGMIDRFDPTGFNGLYRIPQWLRAADGTQGATRDWVAELVQATEEQRKYLCALVFGFASWDDANEEWRAFEETTNNVDAFVLFVLFVGRWPRIVGDNLLPNEAQIAADFVTTQVSNKGDAHGAE